MDDKRKPASAPYSTSWAHHFVAGHEGVGIHYVRQGKGVPVVLLHGWPGFWYDWRHVIPTLAGVADVIAPDFRGFGDSDKPDMPPQDGYSPELLARDIISLLDQLELNSVIIAAHDIGATIAQTLARLIPHRIISMVLMNPPYPGIGSRRFDAQVQGEFWYQHMHNQPWADALIGYDRNTVKIYLSHFYEHWTGRKDAIHPEELEEIIDVYARPGAFKSSISYYRARSAARRGEAAADPSSMKIEVPTSVLWGEKDPVMLCIWADRLSEYFTNNKLRILPDVGHFVPLEAPDEIIKEVQFRLMEIKNKELSK